MNEIQKQECIRLTCASMDAAWKRDKAKKQGKFADALLWNEHFLWSKDAARAICPDTFKNVCDLFAANGLDEGYE